MSRGTAPAAAASRLPTVMESLYNLTVDELKWYAAYLPGKAPMRKADLVDALQAVLTNPDEVRRLWAQLTPEQQQVVGEVVHRQQGRYDSQVIGAKYPGVRAPRTTRYSSSYSGSYGKKREPPAAFDLLFSHQYDLGAFIPSDLLAVLRPLAPVPPPSAMPARDDPPVELAVPGRRWRTEAPEVAVSENERAVFHDLAAALNLVQEGKAAIGAATRLPTLATLRQLRQRLLVGDDLPDEYERAEDAIRPFALLMLVQASRWAAPNRAKGSKLALTKAGQALLGGQLEARHVRAAWEAWLKTDLLDELARIRTLKGQGSRSIRLTRPAERREKLAAVLRACPPGRWVALKDFFRYMRAERLSPTIERNEYSALYIGWSAQYGSLEYSGGNQYWDLVVGSYLRAVLWEYAATLGLIEIAYTHPEESPRDFSRVYGMDDEPYLSRYDGLLGLCLTPLGAYVLGLAPDYAPPAPRAEQPVLAVLPNFDVVVTDARRITPNDRAFLERLGAQQSEDVYRLGREQLLDLVENGLGLQQVREFLAARSGRPEEDLPQPVRVFFADLEQRLGELRDAGRMLVLESDDPLLLTELAHDTTLRAVVQLGSVAGKTVLLVPEAQEAPVRRQLKKLGYLPRRA